MTPNERQRRYWRACLRLTIALLAVWALASFGVGFWAQDLAGVDFFGWPLGFWAAAQGALLVFALIVWIYAWAMDRLERRLPADDAH